LTCSDKYRRCTNCGGTSSRGVIGKWRCKELFEGGRKTCSLSHARLGTRDMEMAAWEISVDLISKEEWPALVASCEQMWREHVLSKLAVPEILENQYDIHTYAEIEERLLQHGFPGRDELTRPTRSPNHRRYISLNWAKARTRRDKSKPEWAQWSNDSKRADQWITYNIRRSTVLYPTNSILCGAWIIEWVIPDSTLVVEPLLPYESTAPDDRSVLHVTEILRRIMVDLMQHNAKAPNYQWQPPAHLWACVKRTAYTLRLRLIEGLQRRSFVPLDEYLTRHEGTRREMFSDKACALANSLITRKGVSGNLEILVRHMGKPTLEKLEKAGEGQLQSSIRRIR